ncbi:MAG: TRAP transporter small permease subunit [Deferribacteraceae bacterium]|jgi:TRAP-type C4-dicarboxylate transport system permease small subunit|nr:TRAP transporter small permease subunit [Deferribacteraceae bacterium]
MQPIKAIYRSLCKAEEVFTCIGLILLVILVLLSAILRAFRVSMAWNMDMAMLLLAWTAFLGADVAYRHGQLLGIDLFTRGLPIKLRKVLQIVVYFSILAALIVLAKFGYDLAIFEIKRTFASLPIPYSIVTLSLVVTAISMVVSTLIKLKDCFVMFNSDQMTGQRED